MNVVCNACHRSIHLGPKSVEKYAGRQFHCPGCGGPVSVPAAAETGGEEPVVVEEPEIVEEVAAMAEPAVAKAAEPAPKAAEPAVAKAAEPAPATVLPERPAPPPAAAAPPRSKPPVAQKAAAPAVSAPALETSSSAAAQHDETPSAETAAPAAVVPQIHVSPGRSHGHAHAGGARSKPGAKKTAAGKGAQNKWLLPAVGGGGAVLLVLAVVAFAMLLGGRPEGKPGGKRTATAAGGNPGKQAGTGTIEFQLAEDTRGEIALTVDGRKVTIPPSGPVTYSASAGTRKVVLRRRGFDQIDLQLVVRDGDRVPVEPEWKQVLLPPPALEPGDVGVGIASPGTTGPGGTAGGGHALTFDDWEQDFEKARQRAQARTRDILVLFDGSDWCGFSMQMADKVFFHPRFGEDVGQRYELVFLDFPKSPGGKAKVQNATRNQELAKRFRVAGFPMLFVMDRDGLPFGRLGYDDGGYEAFTQQLALTQQIRDKRNELFAQVEVNQGAEKCLPALASLELLSQLDLESFYVDKFRSWYDAAVRADPNNESGQLEGLFEVWYRALATSTGKSNEQEPNPAAVAAVAEVLDQWNEKHQFRDSERGARLHLLAALVVREQPGDAARKYAAAGLEFKPRDEKVAQLLRVLAEGGGKWQILGSGSGFLVAAGLVLTNHHVIEGPGRLAVRWPGLEEPLEAKVLAKDDQSDLALLRVQPPGDAGPTPLRISPQSIGRGARVAAFGFPLGELVGKELKLTTGVVSSTAAPATNNMILLDCLVNPGNSGGPLCNPKGQVVGVVTARSLSSAQVGSYGMAVPGTIALEFLRKSIPDFDDGSAEPVPEEGEWDEVDQRVSPAVLMVLKIK